MANVVLYQTGSKSRNPRTGEYYDAWQSHIWLCIEQIRKWNPSIPIYMITDDHEILNRDLFQKYNVVHELIEGLTPRYDVLSTSYFKDDVNPSARACGLRPFYIEAVIRKHDLRDVFTFDNDVLVYCDLNAIGSTLSSLYARTALTPDSKQRMVLGMCYVKDSKSMLEITDDIWSLMNSERGRWLLDMELWSIIGREKGSEFVDTLPIWIDGEFSNHLKEIDGIFDPSSIGQHLLGCDNGNPPGSLFPHHYIHNRLREGSFRFVQQFDAQRRKYIGVLDMKTGRITKVLSIHVHCKKLSALM